MSDCIFCDIVAGIAPARIVHEDERTLAFLDLFPLTPGHTLVVPKAHTPDLLSAPDDDAVAVIRTTQLVARAAKEAFAADGLNVLQTNGAVAMQTIFHLHVHVLPRYMGDGFKVEFTRERGDDAALDETAGRLRAALSPPAT